MSDERIQERLEVSAMREDGLCQRIAALEDALKKLTNKLTVVHASKEYLGIWEYGFIHGLEYSGPTYTDEFEAAKEALVRPAVVKVLK
jgi:hypothetical protein